MGLFTKALLGRVPEITAEEPDERMRAVLARQSDGVRVLDGRGETILVPDFSADAIFVSTAYAGGSPGKEVNRPAVRQSG